MIFEVKDDTVGVGGDSLGQAPGKRLATGVSDRSLILPATRLPVSFRAEHHLPPYDRGDNLSR
jgi:hypothetical protein